ncbi:MAG: antitoxin Xre-like helix-turn-helix domain-containing protein [Geminicoccales bacterium]
MALQPVQQEFAAPGAGLAAYDDDRVASVAAKAYARIADAWSLNNQAAAGLIAVSPRTWARMKTGEWAGRLSRDQLMRVSAITGLYKALHLYFSDALADRWVGLRNAGPMFAGREPIEAMIEGGLPAIMETRNYVDALRGGA